MRDIERDAGRPIGVLLNLQGPNCVWEPFPNGPFWSRASGHLKVLARNLRFGQLIKLSDRTLAGRGCELRANEVSREIGNKPSGVLGREAEAVVQIAASSSLP